MEYNKDVRQIQTLLEANDLNINRLKEITKDAPLEELFNKMDDCETEFSFLIKLGDYMRVREQEIRQNEREEILQTLIDFEYGDGADEVAHDLEGEQKKKHNLDGLADAIQTAYAHYAFETKCEAEKEGYERGFKNATDMLKGFINHMNEMREIHGSYGKTFEHALDEYINIMLYR